MAVLRDPPPQDDFAARASMTGRRALRALAAVAVSLAIADLPACSPFHQVQNVTDPQAAEKVIVGEVRIVNGDLAEWVGGIYTGAALVLDYKLPVHYGRLKVMVGDGDVVRGASFDKHGGVFSVGVKNQDVFILSIAVSSTYILASSSTAYPLLVAIKPSPNRCEYVGSLLVRRDGDRILTDVEDHYDEFRASHASLLTGCDVAKNLGTALLAAAPRRKAEPPSTPRPPAAAPAPTPTPAPAPSPAPEIDNGVPHQ